MADPDEALTGRESSAASAEASAALIEAIARAIDSAPEPDGPVTLDWRDWTIEARAAYAAMVAHLGLVEEWERWCGGWKPTTAGAAELFREKGSVPSQRQTRRRLVSRWTEVDHGSE